MGSKDYIGVAPGVWGMKIIFVNIYMIAGDDGWVLVDAGLAGSGHRIIKMASELFGADNPPMAIILTHGHFDHRGAIDTLLQTWKNVPVYAHPLEIPYLTGQSPYPPPDPTVGGGLMSMMSVFYPKKPIDIGERLLPLESSGSVPFLSDWVFLFTPGHSPGHISLFRMRDRLLIAGDAFVTTKQESAFSTLTQKVHLSGPPMYFTPDWIAAKTSVRKLRDLHPAIAATGHGKPMQGSELTTGLDNLVSHFEEVAVPDHGRYTNEPAKTNRHGVQYVPRQKVNAFMVVSLAALIGFATFATLAAVKYKLKV